MRNTLLFSLMALALGGCTSVKVQTTALRQPDINAVGGYPPANPNEVTVLEYKIGAGAWPEPPGCLRIGAVYSNWGYGDWVDNVPRVRPARSVLVRDLKVRAASMGANAIAWPAVGQELNYAFAYRCSA
jgi:hypothetical protein